MAFSYVGYKLQVDCLTQNTCPAEKGTATDHYGLVLSRTSCSGRQDQEELGVNP